MNTQELSDRLELRALVDQVSILADQKDFSSQVQQFTEDATTEITVDGKIIMKLQGRQAMAEAFKEFNSNFEVAFHLNGQHTVLIKNNDAEGTLYSQITIISIENGVKIKSTIGAIYHDNYARVNGKWLLSARRGNFVWQDKKALD
ncbi:nuclear transport factor 2 family protein [Mucilaginibacter sp. KACC 22063]|uniref:nuclear transport factor 2 family protein n=1 Tax=Mucilaginibacter sp. KACC 22063 TaxID=3025666 RepID=UPI002366AD6D|nr:nuclear transport factor 2 family protein [Mucilaginibacter sp. KACC 22063]WDF55594.1 nuclear transport factor 2 family protein [Mucilaginibacter sp. KACC 22063]